MDEGIATLACRAKTDPDAFAELVRRFHPLMKSLAARYWLPGDTQDEVIQILRIELWNAVKEYRPGRPFEAFAKMFLHNRLKTIVARKVYGGKHVFFREAVSLETAVSDRMAQGAAPSAEDEAVASLVRLALKERLYEVLDQALTDLEKECAIRKYVYEQSYREIRDALGLHSTKPVDNALARAREKLSAHPELAEFWKEIVAFSPAREHTPACCQAP